MQMGPGTFKVKGIGPQSRTVQQFVFVTPAPCMGDSRSRNTGLSVGIGTGRSLLRVDETLQILRTLAPMITLRSVNRTGPGNRRTRNGSHRC